MDLSVDEEEEKKLAIMKKFPLFRIFSEKELIVLLKSSTWLKKLRGDFICRQGDADRSLYVILKGEARIQKMVGVEGKKSPLGVISLGECFGEMSLITGEPRSADVVCSDDGFFLKINSETLNKETDDIILQSLQTKVYRYFCHVLARRLNSLNDRFVKSQRGY